jgi:sugar diacid utilization regulator
LWSEDLKGRDHLKDLVIHGNTLKYNLEKLGVDWIHLAQNMDQWQAFVNIVMNHCAALNARNFLGS